MPFVKGDPRINRKGRPKAFDAWRKLLIELSNEPAVQRDRAGGIKKLVLIQIPQIKDGAPVVDDDGNPVMVDHYATNAEMIARQWMSDPKHQQEFVEGAFGKVPTNIDITSQGEKLQPDDRIDRTLSSLAHAIGEILPGAGAEPNSEVDTAE